MNKLQVLPEEHVELKVLERTVKVGEPVIAPKHITENGEYSAKAEGVTGFDPVTVEVDMQPAVEAGYQKGYDDANEALDEEALLQEGLMRQIGVALDGKTGTSGYDQGYDAGKQAEYDAFWDAFQENGNKTNYVNVFSGNQWNNATFRPKYSIVPTSHGVASIFQLNAYEGDLVELCEQQGITIDFSNCVEFAHVFYGTNFTHIGVVDARKATRFYYVFNYSRNLKTIDKIISAETTPYNSSFYDLRALEEIRFEGTIGVALDIALSPLLSNASVQSIIDALKDLTGATAQTLTFHKDVGNKLTQAQKDAVSAKNWTLVY